MRLPTLGLPLFGALPAAAAESHMDAGFKAHKKAPKGTVVVERGTERIPAATLREALEKAQDGDVIRLSKGRFDEIGPETTEKDPRALRRVSSRRSRPVHSGHEPGYQ